MKADARILIILATCLLIKNYSKRRCLLKKKKKVAGFLVPWIDSPKKKKPGSLWWASRRGVGPRWDDVGSAPWWKSCVFAEISDGDSEAGVISKPKAPHILPKAPREPFICAQGGLRTQIKALIEASCFLILKIHDKKTPQKLMPGTHSLSGSVS